MPKLYTHFKYERMCMCHRINSAAVIVIFLALGACHGIHAIAKTHIHTYVFVALTRRMQNSKPHNNKEREEEEEKKDGNKTEKSKCTFIIKPQT